MSKNGHKVRLGKLSEFRPQVANANKHTERGLRMLDDAMSEDGYVAPMTAVADNEVIDGSARLERAFDKFNDEAIILEHDGTKPIITVRTDIPNAKTKAAQRIAVRANRIAEADLDWDADILQTIDTDILEGLFSDKELSEILSQTGVEPKDAEPQIDKAEELRQKWGTETGQLWVIGNHRILVGDSYTRPVISRLMGTERATMVVTSPPYNQNIDKFTPSGMQKESTAFVKRMAASYSDSKPEEEYRDEQVAMLTMIAEFLTPSGSIFYNHKIRYREKEVISPMEWLSRLEFPVRQEIIWDRGSSITLNARMLIPADERIYWLRVGDDFVFNDTPEIKAWSTVWQIAAKNDVQISAPFATEIPTRCIQIASRLNDIILEPHSGSGTTMVAAENEGRKCYAADINAGYVAVCLERMTTAFPHLKIERVDKAVAA